ncbi:CYTH domain-containing protein [Candidatus Woesearchaeota archaeon]|nr:CYTH domain-containing protein [Candidatus Woesearchaeota archaeon]
MKEIEVKILDMDPEKMVAKLKDVGAEKVEAGLVNVTYFDYPDDRLMKAGSFIRVRSFGHRVELVLKHHISSGDHKIMEEIETTVGDYDVAVRLFDSLGMKKFGDHEKYRATYRLGNVRFEMDKHPSVPWLMEVEAPTEAEVEEGVKRLGLDMSQTTTKNSGEILREQGITDYFFTFKEKGESPDYDRLFE